jgi:glutamate 5-kinase
MFRTLIIQRTRYLNAQNTFSELLSMGVVPIVNENDTVSVSVCWTYRWLGLS